MSQLDALFENAMKQNTNTKGSVLKIHKMADALDVFQKILGKKRIVLSHPSIQA